MKKSFTNESSNISIYNTFAKKKEELRPIEAGKIKLYTCGPTVYNYAHIGNLRTYIFEDVLRKVLEYKGFEVTHVMNVTDVGHLESDSDTGEDKMATGAAREKKTVWEIAKFYEEAFMKDCQLLNIVRPTIVCRATEHIEDMILFIKVLEEKGFTYVANGNVYFAIDEYPDYTKLANLSMDELQEGYNPLDYRFFCLQSKYRKQLVLSFESLTEAQIGDDLNIANGFTVLYDVIKAEELNSSEKLWLIEDFDRVFSLELMGFDKIENGTIEKLIEERNQARRERNWARADEIREELLAQKIELLDSKDGTTRWFR